jgi:hypothetical protein
VRYDAAQGLTAAQQVQARQNIAAAPFDAMAYSGMQVNGGMDVSQEKGTTGTTLSGTYALDGWIGMVSGVLTFGAAQAASAGIFPNYSNYVYLQNSTAVATLAGGDASSLQHRIEGFRVARLGWGTPSAQPLTIGFWSDHVLPGTYSLTLMNGGYNRVYAATYTHNVTNVAQFNVVTIPGDTAGTWKIDNGIGLQVIFAMACGATYTAPSANAWVGGYYFAAPGQVNGAASTGNALRIAGVVVLPGIEAPSAARSPFIMRPYDQELVTCKRYWQKFLNQVVESSTVCQTLVFPVEFRAAPTMAGGGAGFNNAGLTTTAGLFYQTARGAQNLTADARL